MISFVTWKWTPPGNRPVFKSEHVNVLRAMIERNYKGPHRVICVTDEIQGLDPRIEVFPTPVRFDQLQNPLGPRFPSCYRRLWNFSKEAKKAFGPKILSIDIDVIITGDLAPLVERDDATFIGWCEKDRFFWNKVAGGVYLLKTGTHTDVWEEFDPSTSPQKASQAGMGGSDQGWMSLKLYPPKASWSHKDGLVKIKWIDHKLPLEKTRIVSTGGHVPPWSPVEQERYPWIKKYWRL
jgi:hypothetical protein